MDVRRRGSTTGLNHHHHHHQDSSNPAAATMVVGVGSKPTKRVCFSSSLDNNSNKASASASNALPLPLYLTNTLFFTLFFSLVYYLLLRWREKIRNSTPLHILSFSELSAVLTFIASFIYLLGFFGIPIVQPFLPRELLDLDLDLDDHQELDLLEEPEHDNSNNKFVEYSSPPQSVIAYEDEELISSVIAGTTPSYSLESKLGDCRQAAFIRREALQRITGKSLSGLPLEGFDYDSLLGQCCEMPVGCVDFFALNKAWKLEDLLKFDNAP